MKDLEKSTHILTNTDARKTHTQTCAHIRTVPSTRIFNHHTHLARSSTSRRSKHGRTLQYSPVRGGSKSWRHLSPVGQASQSPLLHSPQVTWLPVLSHEKIRENIRYPVKCALCNRVYERYYMAAHERTHTGEQPFQCPICPRRFSEKGSMKMHVVRMHGISDPHELELLTEPAIMEPQHP
ncbi:unnamed protein product [Gongylonema pulchrum]|uniref:C2H2-type domain-containing protein n=1 Tax=Gongylonema pulchrum TaxID=637853 RepID=A0A183CWT5_9BILA|nr:unnamed protein product [Gongylonema pulchrum]